MNTTAPATSAERELRAALAPLRARLGWRRRWRWGLIAAGFGCAAAVLVMLAARFWPLDPAWAYAAACPLIGLAGGWLAGAIAPLQPERVAAAGDRLGLNERLITAWELRETTGAPALVQRQDALLHLRRLDPRSVISLRLDRRWWRVPVAALLACLLLGLWPSAMTAVVARERAERAAINSEVARLAAVEKQLANPAQPLSETEQRLLEALREARRQLAKARDAQEAVEALSQLTQELSALKQPGATTSQAMKQLAAALSAAQQTRPVGEALQSGDLKRAAEALAKLADQSAGQAEAGATGQSATATASEAAARAQALANAARTPGLDAGLASALSTAATALANAGSQAQAQGNAATATQTAFAQAAQALATAGQQLSSAAQTAAAQSALAQAMNALAGSQGAIAAAAAAAASAFPGATASSGQAGQGGNGQSGQGSGQGQGVSNQPGQGGSGASGAGAGSSNGAAAGGNQAPNQPGQSGQGQPTMEQGIYERIYDPTRIGGDGTASTLPGQGGSGPTQQFETPNLPGGSEYLRPYQDVLAAYQRQALESLDRSYIPPALQSLVRDYFTSLDPAGR